MWTSLRSGASAHAGRVHAALVGDPERHRDPADAPLHLRGAAAAGDRADGGDFGGGGGFRGVDDPAAVRVRGELPGAEVPAGAEQDHGDGVDRGGGTGAAHFVQLVAHSGVLVGSRQRRRGAERVVVVHRHWTAAHFFFNLIEDDTSSPSELEDERAKSVSSLSRAHYDGNEESG